MALTAVQWSKCRREESRPRRGRDTARAFNDAIKALPDPGGIVCIPAGRYRIDGRPLIPDRYVAFKGPGGMKRSAAPRRGGNRGNGGAPFVSSRSAT